MGTGQGMGQRPSSGTKLLLRRGHGKADGARTEREDALTGGRLVPMNASDNAPRRAPGWRVVIDAARPPGKARKSR